MTDPYACLGVSPDATLEEIQKSYRRMAMKYHPDRTQNDPEAEKRFKEAQAAWQTLGNPQKRRAYDRGQRGPQQTTRRHAAPHDEWTDAFESVFADIFAQGRRARPHGFEGFRAAAPQATTISLPLSVFWFGGTTLLTVRPLVTCPACKGRSGASCTQCRGRGRVQGAETTLSLTIPPGLEPGDTVRVSRTAHEEDLMCHLNLAQEPGCPFVLQGRHLVTVLPVRFTQLALGTTVELRLPSGVLRIKIPPGTSSGTHLRIPRHGLPAQQGRPTGDLILHVKGETPTTLSKKQRASLQRLDKTFQEGTGDTHHPEREGWWQRFTAWVSRATQA